MSLNPSIRRRLVQLVIPGLAVLILVYTALQLLNGEKGIYSWRMLDEQVSRLQSENAALRADVERLNREVTRLKTPVDKDYVDELIRRNLPMGKEGEVVILISPSGYGGRTDSPTAATGTP